MQILFQTLNLLFFWLQTGLHFEGSVSQDLLGFLKVLNLELLLEKLIFLLLEILSGLMFVLIELSNTILMLLFLDLLHVCDGLDSLFLLLELSSLSCDLLVVILLALNVVLEFKQILLVAMKHMFLLLLQLLDFILLILLL